MLSRISNHLPNIYFSFQVPIGVNAQGLPLGIQVVAAPYNDALTLAVAKYLSKEFGGSIKACKYKNL